MTDQGNLQSRQEKPKNIRSFWKTVRDKQEGMMTLETTLVFTVLFFSILFIVSLGLVLYQQVKLQSLAIRASERGAMVYTTRYADMYDGVKDLKYFAVHEPYRNVPFMDGSGKEQTVKLVDGYVGAAIDQNDLLRSVTHASTYASIDDYYVAKRLRVRIIRNYNLPMMGLAEMFGKKGPFTVDTTATSAITDPADFVRNTDLAMDVIAQTSLFDSASSGFSQIASVLKGAKELLGAK